ncbi:MAG TPA: DinB family protein [Acidimicrobiia bacterium]|nr:DinB family protein [Acidimicrobiia bacterium]
MAEFEGADLRGAQFREVDLTGARVEGANLTNVKMSDVWLVNVDIDGMFNGVRINGVDVTAYVTAELARINPQRALLEPTDPEGMRTAWHAVSSLWDATIERAQQLPEETLHASVDGEFSFVQTLRHLVFAVDKWFIAPILGGEFDPIGLPNTGSLDFPWPGIDRDADPSFAATLAVRRDREARFAEYLVGLVPTDLTETREVLENGNAPVQACLHVVFEEEVAHHGYATRDLDALDRS